MLGVIIIVIFLLTGQCAGGVPSSFLHPDLSFLCGRFLLFVIVFLFTSQTQTTICGCTEECPWLTPISGSFYQCNDGSTCGTGSCCSDRRGRAKCPTSRLMCARPNACVNQTNYCCELDCGKFYGIRKCGGELISGTPHQV